MTLGIWLLLLMAIAYGLSTYCTYYAWQTLSPLPFRLHVVSIFAEAIIAYLPTVTWLLLLGHVSGLWEQLIKDLSQPDSVLGQRFWFLLLQAVPVVTLWLAGEVALTVIGLAGTRQDPTSMAGFQWSVILISILMRLTQVVLFTAWTAIFALLSRTGLIIGWSFLAVEICAMYLPFVLPRGYHYVRHVQTFWSPMTAWW